MQDFYRRISDFKEVITNQISVAIAESTGGLEPEMIKNIDKKTKLTLIKGFNDMLASLETLESNKKPKRRSRTKK